jgi:hypothetical protein
VVPAPAIALSVPANTAQTPRCTGDRWPIMTLGDDEAGLVNLSPVDTTVAELAGLPTPEFIPRLSRVSPVEQTAYTLTVTLLQARLEENGDINLLVADPGDISHTLSVRFPDTRYCVLGTDPALADRLQAARDVFEEQFGTPATGFRTVTGTARVTGVGFFAAPEPGATSGLANGIQLHPVLDFAVLSTDE